MLVTMKIDAATVQAFDRVAAKRLHSRTMEVRLYMLECIRLEDPGFVDGDAGAHNSSAP